MNGTPPDILGDWLHSFEEDGEITAVYRPSRHPFPPGRRPREGLEFRADGTFIWLRPGPDDRPRATRGRWTARGRTVDISFPDGGATPMSITVVARTADKLTITK